RLCPCRRRRRSRRSRCTCARRRLDLCRKVLLQERPDLLPAVERLLDAVGRAVIIEEPVPGAVIAVELVVLAVLLEFGLVLVDLLRSRSAVFVAEDTEQRAGQVLRVL